MDGKTFIELMNVLVWPVVVTVVLLSFRKPLAALIAGLGGRVTKISAFEENPEMRAVALPSSSDKWTLLGTRPIWEHTEWLTREKICEYLSRALYEWDSSHYKDIPDIQTDKRIRELLGLEAPFIALVNSKGEFQRLLDRQKLLEQVVPLVQNEQQIDTS